MNLVKRFENADLYFEVDLMTLNSLIIVCNDVGIFLQLVDRTTNGYLVYFKQTDWEKIERQLQLKTARH